MAEDYKRNFNVNDDEDPCCLYVRHIPANFTEEKFSSLMKDGGRTIKDVMLNKKGITTNYTYGFVHFATHEDALLTRNELNGSPPLYLQMSFAKSKKETDRDKNEYRKNFPKGRGMRIDIDGQKSISQKLKVTAGDSGRRVTVLSPEKKTNELSGLKSPCQKVEKSKASETEVSSQKSDVSAALTHNSYCNCFCCGKKAEFACVTCKKPYCSASCQSSDWITHRRHCKQIKETADLLIKAYRSYTEALDSSYLSESSNSDFEKSQECSEIEKLRIPLGKFEKVSVTNINNPSKFWVRLEKFSENFSKVERELSSLKKHSLKNISCRDNLLCCAVYKNKVYRGRILKEKSRNEAIVYLLDYGETVTTQKSDLFPLSEELRKLPAQAVCCKLIDKTMKEDIEWNSEDILSFQLLAANKTYRADILRYADDIYEVSLINQDGISVFSILAEAKKTVPCVSESLVSANDGVPPSVWTKLKPKTVVKLVPSVVYENDIWCYLLINEDLDNAEIIETEELMKNYSGKDISLCVEEGEFAAGFSEEFKQFFRCIVLKRKRSSFCVRYIDYGNDEEITCINILSETLSKKCSYIVKCVKPTSMSTKELVEVLKNARVQVIVKKISSGVAELTFNFQGEHIMYCHPCYPCNTSLSESNETSETNVPEVILSPKGCSPKQMIKNQNSNKKCKAALKLKKIPIGVTIDVKVSFEDAQFVYLHQAEDIKALEQLCHELNSLSKVPVLGMPAVGDVYCGLFSDHLWYRISIEKKISSDTYKVYFLDFGNYGNLSVKDMRELPSHLFTLPVYCFPTKIKNREKFTPNMEEIFKVKTVSVTDSFNKSTLEVMFLDEKQEEKNKMKKANLSFKKLPVGENVEVQISFVDENYVYLHEICNISAINELSSQLNKLSNLETPKNPSKNDVYCGLSSDGSWYRVSIEEILSPNMYKVFFLDFGNYENVSGSNLRELPSDFFALPVNCIPVVMQNREELPLSMEEIYVISVTSVVKDVQEVKFSLQCKEDVKLPHISSLQKKHLKDGLNEVKISWVDKDVYYCQLSSDNDDVLTMFNILQTCPKEKSPAELSVGDVICAQSSDGCWYRASVLSNRNPSLKVFFLDYGNDEYVTSDCIKFLPKELLEQPTFAIPMKIENSQELQNSDDLMEPLTVEKIKLLDDNLHVVKVCFEIESTAPEISKTLLSTEKSKYKEDIKLPHISSLQKKHLKDGLNEVKISWVDDDIYYCQLSSDNDDVSAVFDILQNCPKEKSPAELSVGDVICAQSSDGCWYRASVLSNRNPLLKVFFLDYGNNEDVTSDCIKFLPKELLEQPTFAVPMRIENLQEIQNSDDLMKPLIVKKIKLLDENLHVVKVCLEMESIAAEISKTELLSTENSEYKEDIKLPHISSLKKKHLKDGLNEVKISWIDKDVYYCQLSSDNNDVLTMFNILQTCPKEKSPAELSVGDVICAQSSDGCWYRASVLSNKHPSLTVFFLDYGNNEDVTSDCIKFLPKELWEQPTFAIPMRIENLQEIQNSDDLSRPLIVEKIKLLHENLHVVKVCLEIESTAAEIPKAEPRSSEKFKEVCEIEPSNKMSNSVEESKRFTFDLCKSVPFNSGEQDIVIYSVDEDGYVFCAPFIEENIQANSLLPQTLTEHCNHHGISFNDGSEPEPSEMVLALYPEDNQWYRGTIIDKLDGSYFVNFVDYGNIEQLELSSLRKMEEKFMELDVQAHMCTLTGFSMTDENKQRVCEELKKFIVFSCREPLRAVVEVRDNDITLRIPKIISALVQKQLVTCS